MDDLPPARFGELLRRRRLAAGLSQEALAERAGLSRRGISDLERGERTTPRLETVRLLADALALDPKERSEFLIAARPEISSAAPSRPPTTQSAAQTQPPGPPAAVPVTRPSPLALPALPIPPTRLIGREQEAAEIAALLAHPTVRLITLTGPGGVGKTRLALAVAEATIDRFADGVALIDLAPISQPALVVTAIARSLGVQEEGSQSLIDSIKATLAVRELLLIIDNFEHLLPAAVVVSDLLATCPGLKVMATSRERLRLRGEHEIQVAPLSLPQPTDPKHPPPLEGLAGVAAVRLFLERAEEARHGFALTAENSTIVAEICRRLDGLPLAIELAAAWVRLLDPAELLDRLERPLPLLGEGPRDLPERQQTLAATIAWSHDLLGPNEQTLYRRLAVFAGGFHLEALEAVHEADGSAAFTGLTALLDKALVRQVQGSGGTRFTMLETIRQYGLERLAAAGEEEEIRARHAAWCLNLAERGAQGLRGSKQAAWLARLEDEHDNLRTALQWALDHGEAETGWRLGGALWRYWHERGYGVEGRRWLERLLGMRDDPQSAARALAHYAAGTLANQQSDLADSQTHFEKALTIYRSIGDIEGEARCLNALAVVAMDLVDFPRARALLEEAILVHERLGSADGLSVCLTNLGNIFFHEGNYAGATESYERALAHRRELGEPSGIATCLANLGLAAFGAGDDTQAAAYFEESLALARSLGTKPIVASCLGYLGSLAFSRGELDRASALGEESLELWQEIGDTFLIACAKTDLGRVAYARGDLPQAIELIADGLSSKWSLGSTAAVAESFVALADVAVVTRPGLAARLLGVAEGLRDQTGRRFDRTYQGIFDRVTAESSTRLGNEAFAVDRAAGKAMRLDDAIAFALDLPSEMRNNPVPVVDSAAPAQTSGG